MPQRWFIIVGNGEGNDVVSERVLAHTPDAAHSIFNEFHKGAVITRTWDCGQDEPKLV